MPVNWYSLLLCYMKKRLENLVGFGGAHVDLITGYRLPGPRVDPLNADGAFLSLKTGGYGQESQAFSFGSLRLYTVWIKDLRTHHLEATANTYHGNFGISHLMQPCSQP